MKRITGDIGGCHENVLAKSFETNPHMIYRALSLKILMALALDHWDRVIRP